MGRLSAALVAAGLATAPAYESSRTHPQALSDLDCEDVRSLLSIEIRSRIYYYVHFAIPCSSWSVLALCSGGSRRAHCPEGDPRAAPRVRDREALGNQQSEYVEELCDTAAEHGPHFSIENPDPSFLWESAAIARLNARWILYGVVFDQCCYGLQFPDSSPAEFCRKRTRILTTCPHLATRLSASCPGVSDTHKHVQALGTCKVNGRTVKRAALAAAYPPKLCAEWARAIRSARDEGSTPQRR